MSTCGRRALLMAASALAGLVVSCTTTTGGVGRPAALAPTPAGPTSAPAAPTSAPAPTVAFTDCSALLNISASAIPADRMKHLQFGCGQLRVPLDYRHPNGQTISIQLVRVHDTQQTARTGSLLVDPGGPGRSGIFLAFGLAGSMSEDMLRHFDLVGFDPRGVGFSSPVRCTSDAQRDALLALDVDVRTPAGLAAAKQAEASEDETCTSRYGATLEHFNTVETARDMDQIRQAVGDPALNYLGFSYGTELGAAYAHLYPTRIRAMVLDGAVDPQTTGNVIQSTAQQLQGFESSFDQFASDCARRSSCADLGDLRADVAALERHANQVPIRSSAPGETRTATGGTVLYAVLSALYSQRDWPALATALRTAQNGDAKGLFTLVDAYSERLPNGQFENSLDVYDVVSCNDQRTDPTDGQVQATAAQWAHQYPLFGVWTASSLLQCQGWQPDRHPVPTPSALGSRPILVVGNLHDPATPYQGAVHLAAGLTTGVVLTWDGEGHTSYGSSPCIDSKVNDYLINGTVPPPKTICPR